MPLIKNPMPPGRRVAAGEQPTLSARKRTDITFLLGTVTSVDYEKQSMTVTLIDKQGIIQDVPITQPYAGTSSYIMATPEQDSMVIIGFQDNKIYPVAYMPNYTFGFEGKNVRRWPDTVKTDERNEFFFRVKKLLPGDVALGSAQGTEIHLGEALKLDDRNGNSFILRSMDDSLISTSLNNSVFCSGIWLNAGIIKRNSIDPIDIDDIPHVEREHYADAKFNYVFRPTVGGVPESDPYYTEYLIEVEDKGFGFQPANDINAESNTTIRKPIIILSMGNFVGNNQQVQSYGKILRPVLFRDPSDDIGGFTLEPLSGDEVDRYGMAFTLFKPNRTDPSTGAFFGVDKEGHFFQFIPNATAGGLGNGRSMSIVALGSLKETWGADSRYNNSWDLKTVGGIRWDLGAHNERDGNPYSHRSIDIRTSSSALYRYGDSVPVELKDFDDSKKTLDNVRAYFKIEKVGGKERKEVTGTRETIVDGSDKLRIDGAREETVIGAYTINAGSNMNLIVGDVFSENVTKEKSETFGSRKTTILKGSSELVVDSVIGNITEKINKVGNRNVTLKTGSINENITTVGSRSFKTKAGDFKVSSTQGDVLISTKLGQLSMKTKVGAVRLQASQSINIKTSRAANVDVTAGSINLKGRGVMGGVITSKSHKDYITGAFLVGSLSVKASK